MLGLQVMLLISEIVFNIGIGILISSFFYFAIISLFVYLNGREIKEYYLIMFGKLTKGDVALISFSIIVFTTYFTLSRYDTILLNIKDTEKRIEENMTGDSLLPEFTFNLNLNVKVKTDESKDSSVKIEEKSTKYFPKFGEE